MTELYYTLQIMTTVDSQWEVHFGDDDLETVLDEAEDVEFSQDVYAWRITAAPAGEAP